MIDADFIKTIFQKGKEAKEKVQSELSNISLQQLNWKPSPESWSIAQCLEHLVISHTVYFPALQKVIDGVYEMSFWERYSPFSGIFGRMLKNQLQEQPKKKLRAPKIIRPSRSDMKEEVVERYYRSLDRFLQYIFQCANVDMPGRSDTSRHYPAESQRFIHIGFESQETVNRESKGNWYHHFK